MNRFTIAALFVLALGASAGATIYFSAEEPAPAAYIMIGDTAYPYDPATSKAYARQIERFGGKAAVLFDDFNRWFSSLWLGKTLGITLVFLSTAAAGLLYWIGRFSHR
jgi:hypothetical protein